MGKLKIVIAVMLLSQLGALSNEWHERSDRSWNRAQSLKRDNKLSEAAEEFKKSAEAEKRSGLIRDERFLAALNETAGIHFSLSEYEAALRYYDLIIKSSDRGSPADRWNGHNGRGRVLHRLGKVKEAAESLETAYSLSSAAGIHDLSALTSGLLGALNRDAGDYARASEYYDRSSAHSEKTGISANRAVSLTSSGILKLARGRDKEAVADFKQALEIDKKENNEKGMAADYHNLATVYIAEGSYSEALSLLTMAAETDKKIGNRPGLASRLNSMAVIHTLRGDYDAAERGFRESLAINERAGNRKNTASINMNLGRLREAQNRKDEAVSFFLEALRISKELIKDARAAERYSDIGERYESRSVFEDAFSFYSLALRREYSLKNMSGIADAHTKIGRVLMNMKRFPEAMEHFSEAEKIIEAASPVDPLVLAENLQNLGSASFAMKKPSETVKYYDRALKALDSAEGGSQSYAKAVLSINNRLSAALASMGKYEEALVLSETDLAFKLQSRAGSGLLKYKNRFEKLDYPVNSNERVLIFLRSDKDTILRFTLGSGTTEFSTLDKGPVVRVLRDKYGAMIDRYMDTLMVDPYRYIPSPDLEEEHNIAFQKIVSFYLHLLSKKFFTLKDKEVLEDLSAILGNFLLEGVSLPALNDPGLVIRSDATLSAFPFETLTLAGTGYLAAGYRVRYVYSLAADRLTSARSYSGSRLPSVLFGDPELLKIKPVPHQSESSALLDSRAAGILADKNREGLNSLYAAFRHTGTLPPAYSRSEIETLNITNTGASAHFRDGAGRDSIIALSQKGALSGYRALHFSMNSIIIPEYPELGALFLSASSEGRADFLTIPDIAGLKLKSDAVFITGSSYYRSGYTRGEPIWHLAHAFMSAGSNSFLSPLWQVDDRSRIWFFITVYQNIFEKKMKPADAVSSARKHFITGEITPPAILEERGGFALSEAEKRRYSNPYYWGSYIHTGH